jgi:hypothetical protein
MRRILFFACALLIAGCGKSDPTPAPKMDPSKYQQGQSPRPGGEPTGKTKN